MPRTEPMEVIAKSRKRCRVCWKMVEVGEPAILTDDRYLAEAIQWHGRHYPRGAWHLWHPECFKKIEADLPDDSGRLPDESPAAAGEAGNQTHPNERTGQ